MTGESDAPHQKVDVSPGLPMWADQLELEEAIFAAHSSAKRGIPLREGGRRWIRVLVPSVGLALAAALFLLVTQFFSAPDYRELLRSTTATSLPRDVLGDGAFRLALSSYITRQPEETLPLPRIVAPHKSILDPRPEFEVALQAASSPGEWSLQVIRDTGERTTLTPRESEGSRITAALAPGTSLTVGNYVFQAQGPSQDVLRARFRIVADSVVEAIRQRCEPTGNPLFDRHLLAASFLEEELAELALEELDAGSDPMSPAEARAMELILRARAMVLLQREGLKRLEAEWSALRHD